MFLMFGLNVCVTVHTWIHCATAAGEIYASQNGSGWIIISASTCRYICVGCTLSLGGGSISVFLENWYVGHFFGKYRQKQSYISRNKHFWIVKFFAWFDFTLKNLKIPPLLSQKMKINWIPYLNSSKEPHCLTDRKSLGFWNPIMPKIWQFFFLFFFSKGSRKKKIFS